MPRPITPYGLLMACDDNRSPLVERTILPKELAKKNFVRPTVINSETLRSISLEMGAHGEDLREEKWGVIVPRQGGDILRQSITSLIEKRAADQGINPEDVRVLEVSPDEPDWNEWLNINIPTSDNKSPRYWLLLGDLDQVPYELQKRMADRENFPGRLAFDNPKHYAAYATKVLQWEKATPFEKARTVLLAARTNDQTDPVNDAYTRLLVAALNAAGRWHKEGLSGYNFLIDEMREHIPITEDDLIDIASKRDCPTVLWTVSHGHGAENGENARRVQGTPEFGRKMLDKEYVAKGPFLPGGIWFLFACFGAATPSKSDYWTWLSQLSNAGAPELKNYDPNSAFRHLSTPGFVAHIPKLALANPDGPLAILGHADLAWVYSYEGSGVTEPIRQFLNVPSLLADPRERRRVGNAVRVFRTNSILSSHLLQQYNQLEEDAQREVVPSVDRLELARLMMHYHDISNFMLLGDPAVRLPIRKVVSE